MRMQISFAQAQTLVKLLHVLAAIEDDLVAPGRTSLGDDVLHEHFAQPATLERAVDRDVLDVPDDAACVDELALDQQRRRRRDHAVDLRHPDAAMIAETLKHLGELLAATSPSAAVRVSVSRKPWS